MKFLFIFAILNWTHLFAENSELRQEEITLDKLIVKIEQMMIKEKQAKLEAKVEDLENTLKKNVILLKTMEEKWQLFDDLSFRHQKSIPRTCHELRMLESDLPSGKYFIDPDGYGKGESPIMVYCNMTTGSTLISHNSEEPIRITQCENPDCYSHLISYKANMKQMITLIDLSSECRQQVEYNCTRPSFWQNGIDCDWWMDRNGHPHFHWLESKETRRICQCMTDEECNDLSLYCNCDSHSPVQLIDKGYLIEKNYLPVTGLPFRENSTSGELDSLGDLECSGHIQLERMPESCKDLWQIGHTLNGFYTVEGSGGLKSVYCDMNKLPEQQGFERFIDLQNIKSTNVYFHVASGEPRSSASFIRYTTEYLNIGQAMNLSSGIFSAPVDGIYFFMFHGLSALTNTKNNVCLYKNDKPLGCSFSTKELIRYGLSVSSTVRLAKGDTIGVYSVNGNIYSDPTKKWIQFHGYLIKELF